MDNNNNYSTLDNIYKILILLSFIGPFLASYVAFRSYIFAIFIILAVTIIPHAFIWKKYYRLIDHDNFQIHIKKILKAFILSMIILIVAFLPTLGVIGAEGGSPSGNDYLIMFFTVTGWFLGPIFSWTYYEYKLMQGFKMLNQQMRENT